MAGFRRPNCRTILDSRRHKKCGHCGRRRPDELLLTAEQIRALDEERARERQRAREFHLPDHPTDTAS